MNESVLEKLINKGMWRICYSNNKFGDNTLFLLPNTGRHLETEMNDALLKLNEGTNEIQPNIVTSYFTNNPKNPFIIKAGNISDAILRMEFNLVGMGVVDADMICGEFADALTEFKKFQFVCYKTDDQEYALQQVAMCGWKAYYEFNNLNWGN